MRIKIQSQVRGPDSLPALVPRNRMKATGLRARPLGMDAGGVAKERTQFQQSVGGTFWKLRVWYGSIAEQHLGERVFGWSELPARQEHFGAPGRTCQLWSPG